MSSLVACRNFLLLIMTALSAHVSAAGFGELRGQPTLGEGFRLEIGLLGTESVKLDPSCFRLVEPSVTDDLPWLKKARFSIRTGRPPVLEIRSEAPLRDPVLRVAVRLECGHEISREYTLMAAPAAREQSAVEAPLDKGVRRPQKPGAYPGITDRHFPGRARRQSPGGLERRAVASSNPLRHSTAEAGTVPEPSLRLSASALSHEPDQGEAQRDILRLEYRMLLALNEQSMAQIATAEKLHNMEVMLGELQQHALGFAQRVEKEGTTLSLDADRGVAPQAPVSKQILASSDGNSNWLLWGVLLGALLGIATWLGWTRRLSSAANQLPAQLQPTSVVTHPSPECASKPIAPLSGVVVPPARVDVEVTEEPGLPEVPETSPVAQESGSVVEPASIEEQLDANPVMELADIMLSFGRVKGAAQTLQEYIDRNPEIALQPWIRLMDVYRMAGMRAEFEKIARNLHGHFNVEVQSWEQAAALSGEIMAGESSAGVGPSCLHSLEDMPHLINTVVELWSAGDVVGYLYQLLRDNRGGQRAGFVMPVVEDILFLIELKETANRMGVAG